MLRADIHRRGLHPLRREPGPPGLPAQHLQPHRHGQPRDPRPARRRGLRLAPGESRQPRGFRAAVRCAGREAPEAAAPLGDDPPPHEGLHRCLRGIACPAVPSFRAHAELRLAHLRGGGRGQHREPPPGGVVHDRHDDHRGLRRRGAPELHGLRRGGRPGDQQPDIHGDAPRDRGELVHAGVAGARDRPAHAPHTGAAHEVGVHRLRHRRPLQPL
mmetsp:Transcript_84207/g.238922  ORF Transcript_84207/g.238922 Transcript_84207/m.238922 type:complete len:215 (+) Transcript_84207:873-1517(+)